LTTYRIEKKTGKWIKPGKGKVGQSVEGKKRETA
jgi:hypothetical protein